MDNWVPLCSGYDGPTVPDWHQGDPGDPGNQGYLEKIIIMAYEYDAFDYSRFTLESFVDLLSISLYLHIASPTTSSSTEMSTFMIHILRSCWRKASMYTHTNQDSLIVVFADETIWNKKPYLNHHEVRGIQELHAHPSDQSRVVLNMKEKILCVYVAVVSSIEEGHQSPVI